MTRGDKLGQRIGNKKYGAIENILGNKLGTWGTRSELDTKTPCELDGNTLRTGKEPKKSKG